MYLATSSANLLGWMLQRAVNKGTGFRKSWDISSDVMRADGAVDNVRIGCRQRVEDRFINAKVLCED